MKKIYGLQILWILVFFSCSKKDIPAPNPGGGTTPTTQLPTGTVIASPSSISYGDKTTFSYNFTNAEIGVWIGGKKMSGQSGNYTSDVLFRDSSFSVVAQGAGGQKTFASIFVSVGPDPRVTLLQSGTFIRDSIIFKPVDSSAAYWTHAPPGCYTYVFHYINQVGITQSNPPYTPPANPEITTNGSCTTNPGIATTHGWGFYPSGQPMVLNGISFTGVFYWHGVFYDQFIIINDPVTLLPKGFLIHEYGVTIWGGVLQNDDVWESYRRL